MLLFVPDQDSPGKKDVTHAFLPEARAFARHHKADPDNVVHRFPANAALDQRRAVCSIALRAAKDLEVLGFFCHGWKGGLQAGYMRAHCQTLSRIIAQVMRPTAYVALFACSAAADMDDDEVDDRSPGIGGDGGFADTLRDACEFLGRRITVAGHSTVGHCSQNPYVRYFAPDCAGKGGRWFVEPKSALWPAWCRALNDPRSTLRFRFYRMTADEVAAELTSKPPPLVA
jgi:hypothetical protein